MSTPSRHAAGRTRDSLMPADSPMPCKQPWARDIFDAIIDVDPHKHSGAPYRANVRAAKRICRDECPVRAACLAVHGHDLELGVVGGFTNEERAKRLGAA